MTEEHKLSTSKASLSLNDESFCLLVSVTFINMSFLTKLYFDFNFTLKLP